MELKKTEITHSHGTHSQWKFILIEGDDFISLKAVPPGHSQTITKIHTVNKSRRSHLKKLAKDKYDLILNI